MPPNMQDNSLLPWSKWLQARRSASSQHWLSCSALLSTTKPAGLPTVQEELLLLSGRERLRSRCLSLIRLSQRTRGRHLLSERFRSPADSISTATRRAAALLFLLFSNL